jgi:acetyl esterase/lipase
VPEPDAPAATGTPDPGLDGAPFTFADPACVDAGDRIDCTDVVYSVVEGVSLHLDIHAPATAKTGKVPAILYLHPGGWSIGSYHQTSQVPIAEQLQRGYAVVTAEYRLTLDADRMPSGITFPENLRDAKTAIRWMRIKGKDVIDPDRIVAMGASAGAHLASLIAVTPDRAELDGRGDPAVSTAVKAFVGMATVIDFHLFVPSNPPLDADCPSQSPGQDPQQGVSWLIGGDVADPADDAVLTSLSATTYLGETTPPMLTFAGTCDQTVPYEGAVHLAERAAELGLGQVEAVIVPGAFHNTTLDQPDAKRRFDAFLDAQLR